VCNRYYGNDPMSSTGRWAQLIASAGCLVFMPNFRGSVGWGLGFAESNHADCGGKDLEDVNLGVDALVAARLADAGRVGLIGWSYGGYAAAAAALQGGRYRAAVMGAGICDWQSFYGNSCLHPWAAICQGAPNFAKFSPIRPGPPPAFKRPWRFLQEIFSLWRFCMGAQAT
jgi:dipeptidyl aminopeptidase/acylaminoacyl peptidase